MATVKQPTHILCNVQSKENKDNRGDVLVFRAFLFPLCSNSCCWITSFARLVPSHNGESLTMVRGKVLTLFHVHLLVLRMLPPSTPMSAFLIQFKTSILLVFFFWMYILHIAHQRSRMALLKCRFRKLVTLVRQRETPNYCILMLPSLCAFEACVFSLCTIEKWIWEGKRSKLHEMQQWWIVHAISQAIPLNQLEDSVFVLVFINPKLNIQHLDTIW